MLRGFKDVLIGDDVDIQCSGSPLMKSDSSVQVFNTGDFFEQLFRSKLSSNFYDSV